MYSKNLEHKVTVRLSEAQFDYLQANASLCGVSPSEFLRMVVNSTMVISKHNADANDAIEEEIARLKEKKNALKGGVAFD